MKGPIGIDEGLRAMYKENELFCQLVKSTCHHQKFFPQ